MQKYSMFVFSRFIGDTEDEFVDWYCGQHVHDLMRIPGFVGFRFYKLSEAQLYGTLADQQFRYLMIWDWETDDVDGIFKEITDRKNDGRTYLTPIFDKKCMTIIAMPVTEYFTEEQVRGMAPGEALKVVNPDRTRK